MRGRGANSFKSIISNKSRSILTIAGVAIGVASVIIINIISETGKTALEKEINKIGMGDVTVNANVGEGTALTENELNFLKDISFIKSVTPITVSTADVHIRNLVINSSVWGVESGKEQIFEMELLHGRLINSADVAAQEKVCVVDREFALKTFKRENITGKTLRIETGGKSESFKIIGVVKSGGNLVQTVVSSYFPTFVYVPYTTFQSITGTTKIDRLAVEANSNDVDNLAANIVRLLENHTGVKNGYQAHNITAEKDRFSAVFDISANILSLIAAISLVVAGLSIMNIMLVSVKDRTREIGIKKALGAKDGDVLCEFLFESLIITFLGSVIGLTTGILLSYAAAKMVMIDITVNIHSVFISLIFTMLSGIIFGVYPAKKAAKLNPVDALRCD